MTRGCAQRGPGASRAAIAAGLVLALASCGDGNRGASRIQPTYDETGKLRLLTHDSNANGKSDSWSYMDGARVLRVEIDGDEDGVIDRWEYYDASQKLEKIGTSRANDGIVDTWTYPAADGTTGRVDISTRRDGQVTRTEFYEGGVLSRAEEDVDGNGAVDKWETYAKGVVSSVAFDTEGTGRPTRRLVYDANGQARLETGSRASASPVSK